MHAKTLPVGARLTEPLDIVAPRCLRLKLFYSAAYAAAQAECFRQPHSSFARFYLLPQRLPELPRFKQLKTRREKADGRLDCVCVVSRIDRAGLLETARLPALERAQLNNFLVPKRNAVTQRPFDSPESVFVCLPKCGSSGVLTKKRKI